MASGARSRGDSRPRFYDLGPRWSSHIKVEASEELGPKITNHGQDPSRLFLDLDPSKAICSITSSLSPCTSSLVHSRWRKKKQSGRLTLLFFSLPAPWWWACQPAKVACQVGLSSHHRNWDLLRYVGGPEGCSISPIPVRGSGGSGFAAPGAPRRPDTHGTRPFSFSFSFLFFFDYIF